MAFDPSEKTILIVDDEIDLCEILQFDLEDAGYRTYTANQANLALQIIETHEIDLVISDIRMPGGDGVFLLDSIRQRHLLDLPVIFVSGFADISDDEAYHKGVNAIFSKPLSIDTLLAYVEFALNPPMERWKKKTPWEKYDLISISCRGLENTLSDHRYKVGRGGIFVHSEGKLPRINGQIRFRLELTESGTSFEGLGICRWARNRDFNLNQPRGVGLEFLELNDESIVLLKKYLDDFKLIPYIPTK